MNNFMKKQLKLFIVQKYIYAFSALEAIKKDKSTPPDECYIDHKWAENNISHKQEPKDFGVNK